MSNNNGSSRAARLMARCALGDAAMFRAIGVAMVALAIPVANAQMTVPGGFSVRPDGSASYSIPIQVPPGIGGIEPKISLSYNSRGGNGQLGVGWTLAGLSVIARCPQTSYQDGARTGVSYSATDRFCLDGQRLMATSGSYGATNTVYAPEIDTYARTTQGVASGTSLAYFTVRRPDGIVYEYGNTADSRVMAKGSSTLVRVWALDKVTDAHGNYMTISYTADSTVGGFYPNTITYTGNALASPALAPASKVVFTYDTTRTDMPSSYLGGYAVGNRALLTKVATYSGSLNVLNYSLGYEDGYDTGRKRLKTVKACDSSGTNCLVPTQMSFAATSAAAAASEPASIIARSAGTAGNTAGQDPSLLYSIWTGLNWFAFDIANTGRTGFVHFSGSTGPVSMKLWTSAGTGTFSISEGPKGTGQFGTSMANQLYAADVNGDGVADIVAKIIGVFDSSCGQGGINYQKGVYLNNGSANYTALPTFQKSCFDGLDFMADMNGDGMTDIVHVGSPTTTRSIDVALAVGDGTYGTSTTTSTTVDLVAGGSWQQLDANGDGILDLVHMADTNGTYYVWTATGSGFSVVKSTTTIDKSLTTGTWLSIDLNGDGLVDLVHMTTTGGTAYAWLNQGNGTFAISQFTTTVDKVAHVTQTYNSDNEPSLADAYLIQDYNGDGMADIVHMADTAGDFYVWTSKGDGTFTVKLHNRTDDKALTTGLWKGIDLTGTGVVDVVHFIDDSGNYKVWNMPRVDRDVPVSIDNGGGVVTRFTEKTLPQILGADGSAGGSYTRAAATAYPAATTTVVPAMRVVTDSYVSDGLGGQYHLGYNYGSARVDRTGRGFLGFEWFETVDTLTSLTQRTTFSQTFPYTGTPVMSTSGVSHATPDSLSKVATTMGCMQSTGASVGQACVVAAGSTYFPFVAQTDKSGNDLDGTPLPMKRTTVALADMDIYGNAKKVTQTTLNPDGSSNAAEDFSTVTTRTFSNDTVNWRLGRVLTSSVAAAGPATPSPVTPGQGSSLPPAAPAPKTPPQVFLPTILGILLSD
jgi:hypothetical protein